MAAKYLTMVGQLQWLVTLGRFDIHAQVATMSRFRAAPTLQWALHLNDGSEVELSLLVFNVPCAHQCVLSPHHFLQDTPNIQDGCHFVINTTVLTFVTADD